MTIFMVETYVTKPGKPGEFTAFYKKFTEWSNKHPDLFKEVKSHKLFSHMFGGKWGGYVDMWEFENMADLEKCMSRQFQDKEMMTTFNPEFTSFVLPGTYSVEIWASVV